MRGPAGRNWTSAAAAGGLAATMFVAPLHAQEDETAADTVLRGEAVSTLVDAASRLQRGAPRRALTLLEAGLEGGELTPHERGAFLYMTGVARREMQDYDGASADWARALAEGALSASDQRDLRIELIQMHIRRDDPVAARAAMDAWLTSGMEVDAQACVDIRFALMEIGAPLTAPEYTEDDPAPYREILLNCPSVEGPILRIPPQYPIRAVERGLNGSCDLTFDVDPTGRVVRESIQADCTSGTFERASVEAVADWRYAPTEVNGEPVFQRGLSTTLDFWLEN